MEFLWERKRLGSFNPHLKKPLNDSVYHADSFHILVKDPGEGQVYQNCAESHRQKQRRLIIFFDGQVDQTALSGQQTDRPPFWYRRFSAPATSAPSL